MQFLKARALVSFYHVRAAGILQNAKQLPNPNQLWNLVIRVRKLCDCSRLVCPYMYYTTTPANRSCNLGTALVSRQWQCMWVFADFRWEVWNIGHRSDHKCRLEYRSPCNTLWTCKGAAVWMKGNKPIHKKMW